MDARQQRFEHLLEPHHDAALGFARLLCRSRSDGDDLFQTAALRAYDRLDTLRDDAAFRPWLYRVIVSVHRNTARRSFWGRLVPLGEERDPAAPADAPPGAADRAARALAVLPPEQREAIVLFEIEGWTIEEIATAQGASVAAVKSRLSRGRDRLRAFYTRSLAAAEPVALPATGGTR